VYGRHGREPLYRTVRALDALVPRSQGLPERLAVGRALLASGEGEALRTGPWRDGAAVDDVEFVDRYLNVNETSYDLGELWSLVEGADLRFLRWSTPSDWDVSVVFSNDRLRELARALPPRAQYRLVEQMCWRPRLEVLLTREGNGPRPPLGALDLQQATLAVSPEVAIEVSTRNLRGSQRLESVTVREGAAPPRPVTGVLGVAMLAFRDQTVPFPGGALITDLGNQGVGREAAIDAILQLLSRGVLYAPHP